MSDREILFRGKRIDNGEWVFGIFCPDVLEMEGYGKTIAKKPLFLDGYIRRFNINYEHGKRMEMVKVDRETVGQYTGLTDKNGTKIFEGDIVQSASHYNYLVPDFCFGITNPLRYWDINKIEVIGNIHDNPELLEGE